jgi:hypothetical protein
MNAIIRKTLTCNVCQETQEFLDYDKILLPIVQNEAPIGSPEKRKALNILTYCRKCKFNKSTPVLYENEEFIEPFIKDLETHSARFEKQKYVDLGVK